MTDCPRSGKLFGCKFRGRMDKTGAVDARGYAGPVDAEMVNAMKSQWTYVRDVCERCGKTVERVKA